MFAQCSFVRINTVISVVLLGGAVSTFVMISLSLGERLLYTGEINFSNQVTL